MEVTGMIARLLVIYGCRQFVGVEGMVYIPFGRIVRIVLTTAYCVAPIGLSTICKDYYVSYSNGWKWYRAEIYPSLWDIGKKLNEMYQSLYFINFIVF